MRKSFVKVILSIFVISTLLGCIAFADTAPVLTLTLEEAQKMALENSVQYNLQDSYISDALDAYYKTGDDNNKARPVSSFLDYFKSQINPDIALDNAALNVKLSRMNKDVYKRTLLNNVKLAFLNIKKAEFKLENKKYDAEIKLKDYNVAKLNNQLGNITNDDLNQYEKAYNNALSDQALSLQDLNKEYQNLNKYIGRELTDYNFKVEMNLEPIDISTIDLEKVRQSYINNDKNLYSLSESANIAKKKYDVTKEKYEHYVDKLKVQISKEDLLDAYSDAERDYDNARTDFEDKTKDLDITLYNTMNLLNGLNDAVLRLQKNVSDGKNDLAKLKMKYDLGLVSRNQYEIQELGLKTLSNTLLSTIADMNAQYDAMMVYSNSDTSK